MSTNKVKLVIGGNEYFLSADDSAEYMIALGMDVDRKIKDLIKANPFISSVQASVLVALEYADILKKNDSGTDNLRAQVKEYLEDAAKAKSERDFYKRELEKLKSDIKNGQTNLFE